MDPNAASLQEIVEDDARQGRMSAPTLFPSAGGEGKWVAPAFAVEQGRPPPPHSPAFVKALCVWPCIGVCAGCKADGSIKLRVVYDLTASGVNEATIPTEKLHCDTLDAYFHLIWVAHEALGVGIWCFVGHVCWGMLLYFACLG